MLLFVAAETTDDFKAAFSIPTGAVGDWNGNSIWRGDTAITADDVTTAQDFPAAGPATPACYSAFGRFKMGTTAGSITLQWAKNGSNTTANATLLAGSSLTVWENGA